MGMQWIPSAEIADGVAICSAFERKLAGLVEERERRRSLRSVRRTLTQPLSFSLSRRKATSVQNQEGLGVLRGRKIKPQEEAEHDHDIEHFGRTSRDSTSRPNGEASVPQGDGFHHHPLPPINTNVASDDTDQAYSREKAPGTEDPSSPPAGHIRFGDGFRGREARPRRAPTTPMRSRSGSRVFSMVGVGARPDLHNDPRKTEPVIIPEEDLQTEKPAQHHSGLFANKYIQSLNGIVGRNSAFHNLTIAERERLGGLEYQAVTVLSVIVPLYFVVSGSIRAIASL